MSRCRYLPGPRSISRAAPVLTAILAFAAVAIYRNLNCKLTNRHQYLLQSISTQTQLLQSWLLDGEDAPSAELPPLVVHYLWCRKGHFEFIHYLSLLSVVKSLKPVLIVFHYTHMPVTDSKGYVTWFEDIQRDVPFLTFKKISHTQYCGHRFFENSDAKLEEHEHQSGVFLSEDVAIVNFKRSEFLKWARKALMKSKDIRMFFLPLSEPHIIKESDNVLHHKCPSLNEFNRETNLKQTCVQLTKRLSPNDIWQNNLPFHNHARNLMYGSPDPLIPDSNSSNPVPSHCHVLHSTESVQFDYIAYASVLSVLYIGQVQHVFVHSKSAPTGALWEKLISRHNVTFVLAPHMNHWHPEIGDLVYGIYTLLRHGGFLMRSDTIWKNKIPSDLLSFTSTSTLRRSIYRIINYSLDLSVLASKRNSEFLRLLLATLRQTPSRHVDAKSEEVAYRVYLEVPKSVKIFTNLIQHLTCSKNLCQPTREDGAAGMALMIQVSFQDGRPRTRTELNTYRGQGVDWIKTAIIHP